MLASMIESDTDVHMICRHINKYSFINHAGCVDVRSQTSALVWLKWDIVAQRMLNGLFQSTPYTLHTFFLV